MSSIKFSSEVLEAIDIVHFGIKGQKHGRRRYQNRDGSWTEEGKRRRRSGDERDSLSDEDIARRERKRLIRTDKSEAVRSGTASEIMKYHKNDLTEQERKEVLQRLNFESSLKNYADKEKADKVAVGYVDRVDKVVKSIDKAADWAATGAKVYNLSASIYNATQKDEDSKLPIVKLDFGKKKKNKNNSDDND